MTQLDLRPIRERLEAVTQQHWRSMRDGNQYVNVEAGEATLVGASRVDGLDRAWNPYSGTANQREGVSRFRDDVADFIASTPTDISALLAEVTALREENERMRITLDKIAYCGSGEDYRVLREKARVALLPEGK